MKLEAVVIITSFAIWFASFAYLMTNVNLYVREGGVGVILCLPFAVISFLVSTVPLLAMEWLLNFETDGFMAMAGVWFLVIFSFRIRIMNKILLSLDEPLDL